MRSGSFVVNRMASVVALIGLVSCGGSGSPTGPSNKIPNVVGSYSGTATFNYPELQQTLTCPASTVVTQSGSTVSLAPIVLNGQCNSLSLPVGQMTIDNTGAIQSESGTYNEPSCGVYAYTASGGFFGREFRFSLSATSSTCYNINITGVLSKS
jgi:hypothetical protein